jgi:predicted nucleic acid-binding protein
MAARRFIDTNVLLYSISRDPAEAAKRDRAVALLAADDLGLSAQVLQEFYVQATRASRRDALPHDIAAGLVRAWARFPVQEISFAIVNSALEIHQAHGFSYGDSAIIAAAQALGCRQLLSEDMSHGRRVGDLAILDPFR